ncbi:MAG: FliI/YscN family ATPase [Bdellovibrionales bacterium]|nr:FliI/YscN family ATPase [Bdellovibrionales bacterium]
MQALRIKELATKVSKQKIPLTSYGEVTGIFAGLIEAEIPNVALGDVCTVHTKTNKITCKVVSFNNYKTLLAPFTGLEGIAAKDKISSTLKPPYISLPANPVGMILDAFGNPLKVDRKITKYKCQLDCKPPKPLSRKLISEPFITGISAIDCLCTLGKGQRIALIAGAGLGKSTLLGMIAKNASVDVSVIALVGERGREVNEFIEDILGEDGLKKSVLVVTTSDESAIRRSVAASTATAIAEMYRAQGKNVLLLVDSITRTARAIRDLSLQAGELPVRQGYTPSVYNELPKLFERAGNDENGSITAIYTVLRANDTDIDPLSEEIQSLLDGHILLTQNMIDWGIRPAIDFSTSISRISNRINSSMNQTNANYTKQIFTRLLKDKELLAFGGTPDPELEAALKVEHQLRKFLSQTSQEVRSIDRSYKMQTDLVVHYLQTLESIKSQ